MTPAQAAMEALDTLQIQCVQDLAGLEALRPEWEALEAQVPLRLPFHTATWNILWWQHFRESGAVTADELCSFAIRDADGQLRGVAPMMITRRPGRVVALHRMVQFLGSDPNVTELRGPLCRVEDQAAVVAAIAAALQARRQEWDLVLWSGLCAQGDAAAELDRGANMRWSEPTEMFHLALPETWEVLRSSRSRNIKESLRKCYNSLRRDGLSPRLRIVQDEGELPAALDLFFELHAQRASQEGMVPHPNVFASDKARAFIGDVAVQMARAGTLRLFQLEIDGRVVATRMAFRFGDQLYLYFSGFRPEWARYSVATTLVAEILQWAIGQGLRRVNLSIGRDVSKTRWSPEITVFASGEQVREGVDASWRQRLYQTARSYSRHPETGPGRWLAGLRRNGFGAVSR